MNDRERLIELIRYVQYLGGLEEKLADRLIANGVTFQKPCKDCEHCRTLRYEHNGEIATRLCDKWSREGM